MESTHRSGAVPPFENSLDYETALAEFLSNRGRYPKLGDVLKRTHQAEIEASYANDDATITPVDNKPSGTSH